MLLVFSASHMSVRCWFSYSHQVMQSHMFLNICLIFILYVRQFHTPFSFIFTGNFSKQILSYTDLYIFCRIAPSVIHVICVVEVICHCFWFDYNLEYPVCVNLYQSCFAL